MSISSIPRALPEAERKAIKDFKNQLADKLGRNLLSVYLFGSKARGDYQKDSDVDVLAVLKNPDEDQINYIYEAAMYLGLKYQVYLSVKVFSEQEFNHYHQIPTRFITNVLKEGIKV